ncbi:hypothetical protein QBC38DRAFT_477029 [Podospora fimiseda]|uniref:G domain-containing protein n=1 Tax=Podospora fimiseda TaxID=252190 RepID=A0AAN7H354_9PEZI|nr:hypothetical protein QBC38DRAFT_477029 [Podospora fimiseda]
MMIHFQDAPVVLVIGSPGSGKSNFVKHLTVQTPTSETSQCQIVPFQIGDKLVYVVEAPDFYNRNDNRFDIEFLDGITRFLSRLYATGCKLRGIIFLHPITDPVIKGSALTQFDTFRELCGQDALGNIIFLTTKWDEVDIGVGSRRHLEIQDEYWESMIRHGSQARKFHPASSSLAEALVTRLVDKQDVVLKVQEWVMRQGKHLDETSAGRLLMKGLDERLDSTIHNIEKLEKRLRSAAALEDQGSLEGILKALDSARVKEREIMADRRRLQQDVKEVISGEVKVGKSKKNGGSGIWIFASIDGLSISRAADRKAPLRGGNCSLGPGFPSA